MYIKYLKFLQNHKTNTNANERIVDQSNVITKLGRYAKKLISKKSFQTKEIYPIILKKIKNKN